MKGFEDYAADQAVFREPFRGIKSRFDMGILRKLDNNGIFVVDDTVFKTEYPLNEQSVLRLCNIISDVNTRYLKETENIYFTIVPDKNAYLEDSVHLILDYGRLETLVRDSLPDKMNYIDIFGALSLEDYFRTDSHWKQERIGDVVQALTKSMSVSLVPKAYEQHSLEKFYGVYYGQSALNIPPDELVWLASETTENAIVTCIEKPNRVLPVYDPAQLTSVDPYNIFMCGSAAVVTAVNPSNSSGRELVIFRDSYASSLAPLLLDAYSAVTLVDLRYISPEQVGQYVDFTGQEVLFMYSATLFNTSNSVKNSSP